MKMNLQKKKSKVTNPKKLLVVAVGENLKLWDENTIAGIAKFLITM